MQKCPGIYCGRMLLNEHNYSDCGVCPTGFRSVSSLPNAEHLFTSECVKCSLSLQLYDWFYLLFMALILLVFEWYLIDYSLKRRNLPLEVLSVHLSALFEVVVSSLITVLVTSETKSIFEIKHCGVYRLSDWYTLFFNPSPDFKTTLRCTQESVYPLYSMIFLFYLLSLLLLITVRPFVILKISHKNATKTIYLTMYVIPALAVIHAIFCGLICK
ncbi:JNK1/MAPK8-associated membrane protein-like protein [Dinothrombium tinctorium]|uniref:JNK1/MAPK8-associated membrane protein-like protein n=1 Tax=Dinothrombium tinctorium TaxID=1965070 RepID=A0A3S3S596_9ACAR|nr:JNK1/MAPK8-associated membrane protein-like protein [Dinothrombium tinctorium]RWS02250.1 JNK1/MAPK8-associated membrane protein-like protein [Dinothrombium tinctorium]RWS09342.1 JNK1/MAPK8-associated membrane protein-like protein [Dinothrombium tinctorium]